MTAEAGQLKRAHERAQAGLIDELCLTAAPSLVGAGGATIFGLRRLGHVVGASLLHVLEEEDFLFLRYRFEAVGE